MGNLVKLNVHDRQNTLIAHTFIGVRGREGRIVATI